MSELIATTELIAEKGFIYFIKQNEDKIEIHRTKAGRHKKVKEVKNEA